MKVRGLFENKNIWFATRFLCIALLFTLGAFSVYATWNDPSSEAPQNNVVKPINVGTAAQVKEGDLTVQNMGALNGEAGGYVQTGFGNADDVICDASLDGVLVHNQVNLTFCIDNGDGTYGWVIINPI